MDLLVLADPDGVVDMTHEAIARRTNRPLEIIRATIAELEAPDPQSRTPDEDGARLKRLDTHRNWGWCIINFDRFHKLASEEARRAKTRERVTKYRDKVRGKPQSNAPVTPSNAPKRKKRHTDVDVDVDENTDTQEETASAPTAAKPASEPKAAGILWTVEQGFQNITDQDRRDWATAYPACTVDVQLAQMNQWLLAHRAKAHKTQWRRFITGWLGRSQERGGDLTSHHPTTGAPGPPAALPTVQDTIERLARIKRERELNNGTDNRRRNPD
jgi:hypothetical protein